DSDFLRARLVRLLSKSFQSDSGRHAGWRPNRNCALTLAVAARIRTVALVRVEVSEFHRLVDGDSIPAARHFSFSKSHRRGAPLLRSHAWATLDDVDPLLRSNWCPHSRNAPRCPGFAQLRRPFARPWAGCDLPVIS